MSFTQPGWVQSNTLGENCREDQSEPAFTNHIRDIVGEDLIVEPPYCRTCGLQGCYCTCP